MTREEIRAAVLGALAEVAPEADLTRLNPATELREQLDIDSMDHLNFVIALAARTGVEVPERDYGKLLTLDAAVDYLAGATKEEQR